MARVEFTVHSAYHLEKERNEVQRGEISHNSDLQNLWRLIWGMHIPNPINMFTWKACHNVLPAKNNLQKRGIAIDPLCLFCNTTKETVRHVFWDYPLASDVWGPCSRKIKNSIVAGTIFAEVIEYMFEMCKIEEVEFHVEVARRIWFKRNEMVHGGDFIYPNAVILSASTFLADYRTTMEKDGVVGETVAVQGPNAAVCWQPPPPGTFKIKWDVALDSKKRKMGVGFIVRDSNGRVSAAASYSVDSLMEPAVVETLAALRAAEFCCNWILRVTNSDYACSCCFPVMNEINTIVSKKKKKRTITLFLFFFFNYLDLILLFISFL
jgi:hypothetical protein